MDNFPFTEKAVRLLRIIFTLCMIIIWGFYLAFALYAMEVYLVGCTHIVRSSTDLYTPVDA